MPPPSARSSRPLFSFRAIIAAASCLAGAAVAAGSARGPYEPPRGIFLYDPAAEASAPGLLSELRWTGLPEHRAGGQDPRARADRAPPAPGPDGPALPERVVLLIHGLDELGGIWDDLAPVLAAAGYTVARFEYPNDDPVSESAALLTGHLRDLHRRGVREVDLVGHSMGGLVARECLTRPGLYGGAGRGHADLPEVRRLITLGTPNHGSPLARYRGVLELRERVVRAYESENWRALDPIDAADRKGAAATDLLPGSDFLERLNARPLPGGVAISIIAARITDPGQVGFDSLAQNSTLAGAVGPDRLSRWVARGKLLVADLGDGVVPLDSTPLAGVDDYTIVRANHRSLVKRMPLADRVSRLVTEAPPEDGPPAIPLVLERLARPQP